MRRSEGAKVEPRMPKPSKRDQLVEATKELLWEVARRQACRLATFKPEAPPRPIGAQPGPEQRRARLTSFKRTRSTLASFGAPLSSTRRISATRLPFETHRHQGFKGIRE